MRQIVRGCQRSGLLGTSFCTAGTSRCILSASACFPCFRQGDHEIRRSIKPGTVVLRTISHLRLHRAFVSPSLISPV